ncbi:Serine/threonine-protein kinase Nek7 [Fulvia fulva]|uniref:Serine/threonine-protein kinase Nek7 n=1 Tax=Passalora fulva TaxID=5499 RepID=A0A9Q8PB92_PASFU|nr:Serine/threonine-protein kinase Nek7 [Fulvia fulva]UJO19247.1 Serine/threonine-protein kinase Nek7 [Fulvia fulva]WPV31449.1 Serine/threonine-protein kinase Nek7 [Fulvia fulva]
MNTTPSSGNFSEMSPQQCFCSPRGVCSVCAAMVQGAGQGIGMYAAPSAPSDLPTAAGADMYSGAEFFDWDAAMAAQSYIGTQTLDGYRPTQGNSSLALQGAPESGYATQPLTDIDCLASPFRNHLSLPVTPAPPGPASSQTIEVPRNFHTESFPENLAQVDMGAGLHGHAVKRHEVPKSVGKRTIRDITAYDTAGQPDHKTRKLFDASEHLQFNGEQTELLEVKLQQWQKRSHLPLDKDLKNIAAACDLSPLKVALWFGAKLRLHEAPAGRVPRATDPAQPAGTTDVSAMIWKYINDAANKDCTPGKPGKLAGKFRCTWGCTYSSDSRFDWERHEESKQPQNFWACISCRGSDTGASFITHRRDKLFPHIHSMHPTEESNKDQLREKSKVQYEAPFIRHCGYTCVSTGQVCGHIFKSWKERNDHWIAHFNDDVDGPSDQPPSSRNRDVGDGGSPGDSNSNSSDGSSTATSGVSPPTQQGSNSGQSKRQRYSGGRQRVQQEAPNGVLIKAEPAQPCSARMSPPTRKVCHLTFIDIHNHELVTPDVTPKFLALDCDVEAMKVLPQKTSLKLNASTELRLPARDGAVAVMKAAIEIAMEMGFQYLWSDMISSTATSQANRKEIYEEAMLITSMGFRKDESQPIWHFTSDFKHLEKVRTWSEQRNWFRHVEALGQGAYGFVDKVKLESSGSPPETYARKIVLRDRTNKSQRARYLREIEIMQSLDHPHVARFIAAYCDRTAFNILMSPVADCDLRRFLSTPKEFEAKIQCVPQWFMSLAEALKYMHNTGLRHKDIKPANILISDNKVLLTDFGTSLRNSKTGAAALTSGGTFLTPKYSAPEVAAQKLRGLPADIFSLGCVFAEMIAIACEGSLEHLHESIGLADEGSDSDTNYNRRIPQLQAWLRSLDMTDLNASLKRAILVTVQMVNSDQTKRPLAPEIVRQLCSKEHRQAGAACELCSDQQRRADVPTAACHCCSTSLGICHGSLPHDYIVLDRLLSLRFDGSNLQKLALQEKIVFDLQINADVGNGGSQSKLNLFKQHFQQALQDQAYVDRNDDYTDDKPSVKTDRPPLRQGSSESYRAYQKRVADAYAMSLDRPDTNRANQVTANTIRGIPRFEEVDDE